MIRGILCRELVSFLDFCPLTCLLTQESIMLIVRAILTPPPLPIRFQLLPLLVLTDQILLMPLPAQVVILLRLLRIRSIFSLYRLISTGASIAFTPTDNERGATGWLIDDVGQVSGTGFTGPFTRFLPLGVPAVWRITIKGSENLPTPTGFSVQPGNRRVALSWDDPDHSSITGWQYQQRLGGRGTWGQWQDITGSSATTTSHIVTGLINNFSYSFKVRAKMGNQFGPESPEQTVTPGPIGVSVAPLATTPSQDREVTATVVGINLSNLNWVLFSPDGADAISGTADDESCGSSLTFPSANTYTSGTSFTISSSESDNGKRICFRATVDSSTTIYGASSVIAGIDTTSPTVISEETKYYSSSTFSEATELVDGSYRMGGQPIYTKVKFSENIANRNADFVIDASPSLWYTVNSRSTSYHIVAHDAALLSGDCKAKSATDTSEYHCLYTVGSDDSGVFRLRAIHLNRFITRDLAGNGLIRHDHDDTITLDTTAPTAPTLALTSDTGTDNSDRITSNAAVTVSGLEPDASWEYRLDVDGNSNEDFSGSWTSGSGTAIAASAFGTDDEIKTSTSPTNRPSR